MSILIEAAKGNEKRVVDEAKNKKEANNNKRYWQNMLGKGWKISTRVVK